MKKTIYIIASLFMLVCTSPIFAQADPGDDPESPAAPIDNYLWYLAAIGLVYVFPRLKSLTKIIKAATK
jgi:hypothetical protein